MVIVREVELGLPQGAQELAQRGLIAARERQVGRLARSGLAAVGEDRVVDDLVERAARDGAVVHQGRPQAQSPQGAREVVGLRDRPVRDAVPAAAHVVDEEVRVGADGLVREGADGVRPRGVARGVAVGAPDGLEDRLTRGSGAGRLRRSRQHGLEVRDAVDAGVALSVRRILGVRDVVAEGELGQVTVGRLVVRHEDAGQAHLHVRRVDGEAHDGVRAALPAEARRSRRASLERSEHPAVPREPEPTLQRLVLGEARFRDGLDQASSETDRRQALTGGVRLHGDHLGAGRVDGLLLEQRASEGVEGVEGCSTLR